MLEIPRENKPIPPVDPEDLKRRWKEIRPHWTYEAPLEDRIKFQAVFLRGRMIRMLVRFNQGQLLAPWKHGEELDDAVFRIAATFPMRTRARRTYQTAGDDLHEFDPNVFVQQLIAETGIPHTWEPIITKMPEGMGSFHFSRIVKQDQATMPFVDQREARLQARQVLWDAWDKYFHIKPDIQDAERHASVVAGLFGDFVLENIDLAQQLISYFSGVGDTNPSAVMTELERRAKVFMRPIPPT